MTGCLGKPRMVIPDISKLDVPRLLSDIPKYNAWVSPFAWKDWEVFLQDINKLTSVPDVPWNVERLISTAIASNAVRTTAVATISEDLQQILNKSSTVPAKVQLRIYSCTIFTLSMIHVQCMSCVAYNDACVIFLGSFEHTVGDKKKLPFRLCSTIVERFVN